MFDLKSMSRKKSKASIKYPKEAVLGNSVYELRGVISHQGTSVSLGRMRWCLLKLITDPRHITAISFAKPTMKSMIYGISVTTSWFSLNLPDPTREPRLTNLPLTRTGYNRPKTHICSFTSDGTAMCLPNPRQRLSWKRLRRRIED